MSRKIERHVDTFRARPKRGPLVFIEVFQEYIDASHAGSADTEWIAGIRRYQVRGGPFLNKVDDETYVDPATGDEFKTR